jgi:hypothetical protein
VRNPIGVILFRRQCCLAVYSSDPVLLSTFLIFTKQLKILMKSYKLASVLCLCFIITCFTSCKKNNDNPLSNIRISSLDFTRGGYLVHYRFVYDKSNNIDSIVTTGSSYGYKKFTYVGSSYSITDETGSYTNVQASTDGKILGIIGRDSLVFVYNADLLGRQDIYTRILTPPYYTKASISYTWNNGDLTELLLPGNVKESSAYDAGKTGQAGDAIRIEGILNYGRSYIKTAHVPVDLSYNGTVIEKYLYAYDGDGRITELTKVQVNTSGANDTILYKYRYN